MHTGWMLCDGAFLSLGPFWVLLSPFQDQVSGQFSKPRTVHLGCCRPSTLSAVAFLITVIHRRIDITNTRFQRCADVNTNTICGTREAFYINDNPKQWAQAECLSGKWKVKRLTQFQTFNRAQMCFNTFHVWRPICEGPAHPRKTVLAKQLKWNALV